MNMFYYVEKEDNKIYLVCISKNCIKRKELKNGI